MAMLDHLGIGVADHERSKAFYERALAPLGCALVDAFHAAALEAGGTDNGAPGVRWYHDDYYGGYLLDPDGNNVEAVCHKPA